MPDLSDMFDDPEPLDENDPEVPEEMLELHKYRKVKRKRPDFPSGIFIGLGLTIWSCIRQRELHIAFADFVRLQRSGRS